ncbi:hypothetical protein P4O66_012353 [Electrophorus voltai]|uniref:Uncharacterized protein n=1 Tax=Electrophorus voltai TaxID=2609070 RepID=A0AAD9DSH8_9TELE|nr:hypothetical protein P4O66_012353 [Electrophorus voltai]
MWRVYCLTRAVLEMLKYLQYGKLFFKWKSWYRKVKNNKQCVKGTVLHMIQDISDSLVCVRENGHSFSTDKMQIPYLDFCRVPPVGRPMTDDVIFPVELSVRFSKLLTLLSVKTTLYLLPEMNHIQIVTDFMAPDRHFYRIVFGCIKREYSKFMRTY